MVTTNVNMSSQTAFTDLVKGMDAGNQDRHVRFKGGANADGTVTLYTHQKFSLTALKGWLGFTGAVNARAQKQASGLTQVKEAIRQQYGDKFAEVVAEKAFKKLGVGERITVGQLRGLENTFKQVQADNTQHVRQLAASNKPELAYLMALHYGHDKQEALGLINQGRPEEKQWAPKGGSMIGSVGTTGSEDVHFSLSKFMKDTTKETADVRKSIGTIFQGAASQTKLESTIRDMAEDLGAKRVLSNKAFDNTQRQVMLHLASEKGLEIQTQPLGKLSEDLWQGASNFLLQDVGVPLKQSFHEVKWKEDANGIAPLSAKLNGYRKAEENKYAAQVETSVNHLRMALKLLGDNLAHNNISPKTGAEREALFDGQLRNYADKLAGNSLQGLNLEDQQLVWTSVRAVWVDNPENLG